MSAAVIVLEDHDGAVAMRCTFEGGFDKGSHAHQHAQILIKQMDALCEQLGPAPAQVIEQATLLVDADGKPV